MNQMTAEDRFSVDETGSLEILDPTWDDLELLRDLDPGYSIRTALLPGFTEPRLGNLRRTFCEWSKANLRHLSDGTLRLLHEEMLQHPPMDFAGSEAGRASLLDVKTEMAARLLRECCLCGRRCGVDRWHGEIGSCGLGRQAWLAETFVHIGEEACINPSLLLGVSGCALRCRFCQKKGLQKRRPSRAVLLCGTLWDRLDYSKCRSMSFIGGNPDESLWAILRFLNRAPQAWSLPIVWNCSGYGSTDAILLLEGLVDAYVPDFKFGNNRCSGELARVTNYVETASQALVFMLKQEVPVICRLLVLPGHYRCCHAPVLETLASIATPFLFISVRPHYRPAEGLVEENQPLSRRPFPEEVEQVRARARQLGLQLLDA